MCNSHLVPPSEMAIRVSGTILEVLDARIVVILSREVAVCHVVFGQIRCVVAQSVVAIIVAAKRHAGHPVSTSRHTLVHTEEV